MHYDPNIHHRRSTRLKGYDYAQQGAYFVTICTHAKQWVFGEVQNDRMVLNALGKLAAIYWTTIPEHFPHIELDEFVIMPNHVHGILLITDLPTNVGVQHAAPSLTSARTPIPSLKAGSLSAVIRSYKSAVTRQTNRHYHAPSERLWQRNFHDHIIRNEKALNDLRTYVTNNPASWAKDVFHSDKFL